MMYGCVCLFKPDVRLPPAFIRAETAIEALRLYQKIFSGATEDQTVVAPFPDCPVQVTTFPLSHQLFSEFDEWYCGVRDARRAARKTGLQRVIGDFLGEEP